LRWDSWRQLAYRFARGDAIGMPPYDDAGRPATTIQIERPLDFAAVTDHAEWLGELRLCRDPESPSYDSSLDSTSKFSARSVNAARRMSSVLNALTRGEWHPRTSDRQIRSSS
jgi:hypothetical protein